MKTVLNNETITELTNRIYLLSPDRQALWGKMTAYQMVKHCSTMDTALQNNILFKRHFSSLLLGKMILKQLLKNDLPIKKNLPTSPYFIVTGSGDLEIVKKEWASLLGNYSNFAGEYMHPFFGKMSKEQIGRFVYKHADHHLRQFGV